jgi:Fic/DOC family
MSTLRSQEPLPDGRFTPAHYRRVHHHPFQDVYSWAGKYRTVRTTKGGNMFCYPEHITSSMDQLFKKLALAAFKPGASAADFLDAATHFLADLNAIHPFPARVRSCCPRRWSSSGSTGASHWNCPAFWACRRSKAPQQSVCLTFCFQSPLQFRSVQSIFFGPTNDPCNRTSALSFLFNWLKQFRQLHVTRCRRFFPDPVLHCCTG